MAMPEQDGWEYTGLEPDGRSYVCSAFSTALWKEGGLFNDLDINATEFVPIDMYELNFFNTDFQRPEACVKADPDLPYC